MKIEPSEVPNVDLIGPGTPEFREALLSLTGQEPDETLRRAAQYAVIVRNRAERAIALLGVRFDMVGERARRYSVVHYADSLRNPEKSDLKPGALRFVCAEPLYTDLVLRKKTGSDEAELRARLNLDNLARAIEIRASLDCAAFDDGSFAGPDSLGAMERLRVERESEVAFLNDVLNSAESAGAAIAARLSRAIDVPAGTRDRALIARRAVARRLHEAFQTGGYEELMAHARSYRPRIAVSR